MLLNADVNNGNLVFENNAADSNAQFGTGEGFDNNFAFQNNVDFGNAEMIGSAN